MPEMRNVGLQTRSDLGLFRIGTHSELNWFPGILASSPPTEQSEIVNLEVVWEHIECILAGFRGGKNLIFERFLSWPRQKRGLGGEATSLRICFGSKCFKLAECHFDHFCAQKCWWIRVFWDFSMHFVIEFALGSGETFDSLVGKRFLREYNFGEK